MAEDNISTVSLLRTDYTIGWISALAIEYATASSMLGKTKHKRIPNYPGDDNTYVLGSIGERNVVITTINEAGGLPAHVVAANLMKSYPKIRYILMVGIGGGIPSDEYEIRLGDIVVSEPTDRTGGVVQSDFGKWETDGFKHKGSLNRPADGLIRVMGEMKRRDLMNESQIHTFVHHPPKGTFRNPKLWTYQGRQNDPVYMDDPVERSGGFCEDCEDSFRKTPDPQVHYGIIASGNQVIKSREQRDKLYEQLHACCVEMEAFGLMNNFPCLVIRGISDYADGTKNDKWQPYAALAAASYAKELLLVLSPVEVEKSSLISEQIKDLDLKLDLLGEKLDESRSYQEEEEKQHILKWLSPLKPWEMHLSVRKMRLPDTGTSLWNEVSSCILNSPQITALWALGVPGAGKTVAMSAVIDNLLEESIKSKDMGVAYIYLEHKLRDVQITDHVLGTLAKQLLERLPQIPDNICTIWKKYQSQQAPTEELSEILIEASSLYQSTFLCIDALDECGDANELLDQLAAVQLNRQPGIRFVLTGRPSIKFLATIYFTEFSSTTTIRAQENDVTAFASWKLEQSRKKSPNILTTDLETEIVGKIVETFDGIFLLPVLHMNLVLGEKTIKRRRNKIAFLQPSLDGTFKQSMDRIKISGDSENATNILMWLHLARRPLTVNELLHALAVADKESDDEEDLTAEYLQDPDTFLDCCLGLVVVDPNTSIVRLFHSRLGEYFAELGAIFDKSLENGQSKIASACLHYIMLKSVRDYDKTEVGRGYNAVMDSRVSSKFVFINYASRQWADHLYQSRQQNDALVDLAVRYLVQDLRDRYWSHWYHCLDILTNDGPEYIDLDTADEIISSVSPLHIVSEHGLGRVLEELLRMGIEIDPVEKKYGRSPLLWAVSRGHQHVVKLLINHGAQIDMKDDNEYTALSHAIENRHMSIIQGLVDNHASLTVRYRVFNGTERTHAWGMSNLVTPLSRAVTFQDGEMVQFLLENGADSNFEDEMGRRPLSYATETGNQDIAQLLIENNAETQFEYTVYDPEPSWVKSFEQAYRLVTLLLRASELNSEAMIRLLLQNGAILNVKDSKGWTPLAFALEAQNHQIMKLLFEKDLDANFIYRINDDDAGSTSNEGRLKCVIEYIWSAQRPTRSVTLLLRAVELEDPVAVKILLDNNASVDLIESFTSRPLTHAVVLKHHEILRLLLSKNADSNYSSGHTTPLWFAVEKDDTIAVELLLQHGAKPDLTRDYRERTPLVVAIERGNSKIQSLLLEAGAAVNFIYDSSRDVDDWCDGLPRVYTWVSRYLEAMGKIGNWINHVDEGGLVARMKVLVDDLPRCHCPPLAQAAFKGDYDCVKLLLDHAADPNYPDKYGLPPIWHAVAGENEDVVRLLESVL